MKQICIIMVLLLLTGCSTERTVDPDPREKTESREEDDYDYSDDDYEDEYSEDEYFELPSGPAIMTFPGE